MDVGDGVEDGVGGDDGMVLLEGVGAQYCI